MNLNASDAFLFILRGAVARRLESLRASIERAVLLGEPLETLRAEYLAAEAVEASIEWPPEEASQAEAIAALSGQWPADFPPLPVWFTDPAAAAAADPLGPPCVVACSESDADRAARLAADSGL